MKSVIYYLLGLLAVLTISATASAQSPKLYRFAFEQDNSQQVTVREGILSMESTLTAENELAQLFIIRRISDHTVCIASAVNPELFLKRDGNTVVLANYQYNTAYDWTVHYSGYPFASLVDPMTDRVLSWQGNTFTLIDIPNALSDNNDTSGDHYRLRLETVSDTF